jgi:nucleoside-diphosphate-sugar epimerase
MRHVITGGSGFTGCALTRQLLGRHEEIVDFDLKPHIDLVLASATRFVCGDVRKPGDLARLGLGPGDVVYHLAARQFADPVPKRGRDAWFAETNVEGTRNVVAAMRAGGASRLVYFSTDMTYGMPQTCPVPPDHPQNPLGPYGRGKLASEKILLGTEGIRATIFRPRLITGPGRLGILGKLFALIKAGLPVPMIGSGANRYQMVGVDDCARAAILAADAGCPSGPFNLGSAEPPTTRELLQAIIHHARSRSILVPVPAAVLKPVLAALDSIGATLLYPEQFGIADIDILLDTSETRRVLGWAPRYGDIEMMKAAYDAFTGRAA